MRLFLFVRHEMKLIDEWKKAHTLLSIQIPAAGLALTGAWSALPDDMKTFLPPGMGKYLAIGTIVLTMVGRLIKQDKP